ncbi:histidine phosphatase family protein [Mesorhizobium sp. L-8-3]|uniref:histidine phosphatase family protein n=1 Tax=Mesorhizobium sp. L-8-3 TaxID=2744522 RepID=UPI00192718E3|nr:histidine phosphatase family protein [Mesorhizobium sp. L-8-3]BCH26189.1 phosphoglycerate mutase [Mesorhizobium sp. L-8-3]
MTTSAPVYFVRHGQTDWNAENRLQGQAETDINALGREQATQNGRTLKALIADPSGFDFVASPLRRTRETMERIRRAMGLDPFAYRTDARLAELNFGDWQGFTYDELELREPGSKARRALDKWNFQPPGDAAESYEMLKDRVAPWLGEVTSRTVCVTHGGIFRVLFRMIGDLTQKKAAVLPVPQDRVLMLENGTLTWL